MKLLIPAKESADNATTKQYMCGPCSNYGGCR